MLCPDREGGVELRPSVPTRAARPWQLPYVDNMPARHAKCLRHEARTQRLGFSLPDCARGNGKLPALVVPRGSTNPLGDPAPIPEILLLDRLGEGALS